MLTELFPGLTDFTVPIVKIPQIQKYFSAMLPRQRPRVLHDI